MSGVLMMKNTHSAQGFVLIEVLVALLIFAFGMLGLLGFQANAAKLTTESQFRITSYNVCYTKLLRGKTHPWLRAEGTTLWGAAVGGNTVIRRSAIGLSQDGSYNFV